jgi:hypothetical protein
MPGEQSTSEVEIRTFSPDAENDIIGIVNAHTAGWPYSRAIDARVMAHWRSMGDRFQPHHLLLAYNHGVPKAFLHGEWTEERFRVHILAVISGAVGEAMRLLQAVEQLARRAGASRIVGPTWRAFRFYNGYVLGHEAVSTRTGSARQQKPTCVRAGASVTLR